MSFDYLGLVKWAFRLSFERPRHRISHTAFSSSFPVLEDRTLLSAVPIGAEVRVNTQTQGNQQSPSIAMDLSGNYVITWVSDKVYAQRYNALGIPQGGEIVVSGSWTGAHTPRVGMDSVGDFVVVYDSNGTDGSGYGIYARQFNSAGVAQGGEFRVNTTTDFDQENPSVALDADGDFVVCWQGYGSYGGVNNVWGIFAQRFNSSGVPQGGEFKVSTAPFLFDQNPSIGMFAGGDFVVTWEGLDSITSIASNIYAHRFNSAGVAQGDEFTVNTTTAGWQSRPMIAVVKSEAFVSGPGNFVITWDGEGQDTDGGGIYAQIYNGAGVPQGSEFRVNTTTFSIQMNSSVAMDYVGRFVVSWGSADQDGDSWGIYAQQFDSSGAKQGTEHRVNTKTQDTQDFPSIAMNEVGAFVITWQSNNQDGSGQGVYAQRYGTRFEQVGVKRGFQYYLDSNGTYVWEGTDTLASFGLATDIPLIGDWNGDGFDEIGVWRSGAFYLDLNGNGKWDGGTDKVVRFGLSSDKPLAGDWNGDGITDVGVWRSGTFYLDYNGNGKWDGSVVDRYFRFGSTSDTPIVGDWNGDRKAEIGVWRAGQFYLDANGNGVWDGISADQSFSFGSATDKPVIGDWNYDGVSDVGIRRGTQFWLDANGNHKWDDTLLDQIVTFGNSNDTPLIGFWRPTATGRASFFGGTASVHRSESLARPVVSENTQSARVTKLTVKRTPSSSRK